jgi:hypothetical protein
MRPYEFITAFLESMSSEPCSKRFLKGKKAFKAAIEEVG